MEGNIITTLVLPLSLAFIMMGMGLSLTVDHFKRVVVEPKAISLGIVCQILLLPAATWGLILAFGISAEMAVGFMILAACPGGATSNIFSYHAKGDTALSVSLTAISSLITVFSIPLIVNLASNHFLSADAKVQLPFVETVIKIGAIVIVPVVIGMLIKRYAESVAAKLEKPISIFSVVFLFLIILSLIIREKDLLVEQMPLLGPYAVIMNLLTMALGYGVGKMFVLTNQQNRTIAIEVGIQNGTLAIVIASSILQQPTLSIPSVVYSILMFFTAAGLAVYSKSRGGSELEQKES